MTGDRIETGTCSACGGATERGSSGAWWHVGATCHGGIEWTTKATFQPDRTPTGDLPDECTGCGRDDGPMYLDPRPRHPRDPQPQYCRDCAVGLFDLDDEESDHA